ncbi:MAG: DsbA family protein [Pseudomonadota bacterium]
MKYAHLIIGLLAGTALGGSVVAATGASMGAAGASSLDKEAVKQIVRDVLADEPKLIIESVQKFQADQQKSQLATANEALKDEATRDLVFKNPDSAFVGPADSKRVVVEFFDYNCGACKMMFKSIEQLVQKDPSVKVILREYPIFGPVSDTNSKLGLAVNRLYPEKYFEFHTRMLTVEGRVDEKTVLTIAKDLGLDTAKIKAESEKKEVWDIVLENRKLGDKLHIQGTPTLVIGDEIVPHGMSFEDLEAKVNANTGPAPKVN